MITNVNFRFQRDTHSIIADRVPERTRFHELAQDDGRSVFAEPQPFARYRAQNFDVAVKVSASDCDVGIAFDDV